MFLQRLDPIFRHCVTKKLEAGDCKFALGKADGEAMKSADVQDGSEVVLVRLEVRRENKDVINVNKGIRKSTHYQVHHPLESLASVSEAKRHLDELP